MNLLYITHYPKSCATKPAGIQIKNQSGMKKRERTFTHLSL
ncbi:hypothetical protein [Wolbachia pipientis]